jgi:salicylate hydroxylase
MRSEFKDWDPKLQKILAMIPRTLSWRLMDRAPMETWVHKCGTIVLLGDSCHPMLPYRAQGAAMAIEDAAVLGNMFSRFSDKRQIEPMLRAYEKLRHKRASATQAASRMNQETFHYADGPEQAARDAAIREAWEMDLAIERGERAPPTDEETLDNPNQWADRAKARRQFAYDADQVVDEWWAAGGKAQMESVAA